MHRALAGLAAQVSEPWARAAALESLAEIALWLMPEVVGSARSLPAPNNVLAQARADLGLAAGLLHRLGFRERAARCEQRWARLAWPALGVRVAEAAESPHPRPGCAPGAIRRCLVDAGFLTADPRVLRDLSPLYLLATSPLPVLIQGESGTGKEVVARALHRWSQLRGEFVAIHCGAIPRDLLESELFGHTRGAFTGAALDKIGLVEAADRGSLFLDEIGEMGMEAQMKMLRVLESGEVRRLGDLRPRQACIRLIAATHRHLDEAVRDGSFRLDLFHRIRGITVRLRPLRERRGDIVFLAAHFLQQAYRGEPPGRLPDASLAALLAHDWPGNVRELRSVLLRSTHLARALGLSTITPEILGLPVPSVIPDEDGLARVLAEAAAGPQGCELPGRDEVASAGLEAVLEQVERRLITNALEESGWNRTRAARNLGGLSRTTLISKMKRLGIQVAADRSRPDPDENG
jgi:two-component system NtrC family response regulator